MEEKARRDLFMPDASQEEFVAAWQKSARLWYGDVVLITGCGLKLLREPH